MKNKKLIVICAEIILAIVAFVLLIATASVKYTFTLLNNTSVTSISGIEGIFGNDSLSAVWTGILSFIFMIVALVILLCLCVLSLLKKKFKLAGICKFVAAGLLIVAGIFIFFEVAAFKSVNGDASFSIGSNGGSYSLGIGWIISAILSIAAGGLSCAEAFILEK